MTDATSDTRSVIVERTLSHPVSRIWRALTEPHLLAEWLMQTDFEPVVGKKFNFRADPQPYWNGVTDCEVLCVEPMKRLAYSWAPSGDEAKSGMHTVVTFTLEPVADGVRVRMEQTGFRPHEENNRKGAVFGWNRFLDRLGPAVDEID